MSRGFVYVLVNPALPGMVKVGKTAGPPEDRAEQLSSATGVPSAFIVAYAASVANMDQVEADAHALLSASGYRLSSSREFFTAAPTDAINAILAVIGRADIASVDEPSDAGLTQADEYVAEVANFIHAADRAYAGSGDTIQDTGEAIRLYKLAIAHGSAWAHYSLGVVYADDEKCADLALSMKHLRKASEQGVLEAQAKLALEYARDRQLENATKCWKQVWLGTLDGRPYPGVFGKMYLDSVRLGMPHVPSVGLSTILSTIYEPTIQYLDEFKELFDQKRTTGRDTNRQLIDSDKSLFFFLARNERNCATEKGVITSVDVSAKTGAIQSSSGIARIFRSRDFIGDFTDIVLGCYVEYEPEQGSYGVLWAGNVMHVQADTRSTS